MNTTRREFLHTSLVTAGSLGALGLAPLAHASFFDDPKPLRILILGGTGFLGPAVVNKAIKRGHTLTLFNRGRTQPHLFPDIEKLQGDRDGGLDALKGREWDAVVDTSGYVPRIVKDSAELLAPNVKHYIFISTVSVYATHQNVNADETDPVGTMDDETVEDITGATYGPLKALCEKAAETAMPGRVANIRPGLIVGPGDGTDRFTYWPIRIARGGEVLAPGTPDDPIQIIDVRDLGEWIVRVVEQKTVGVFNAITPGRGDGALTIGSMLAGCMKGIESDARLTWVEADFLQQQGVAPWAHMPAWVPPRDGYEGFGRRNVDRAVKAGLKFRPISDIARDTLAWFRTLPEERQSRLRAGISAAREAEVLAAWHARS